MTAGTDDALPGRTLRGRTLRGRTLPGRLARLARFSLVAVLVAACGGSATPSPTGPAPTTAPSLTAAPVAPIASPSPRPTPIQVATPSPSPTSAASAAAASVTLQATTLGVRLPVRLSRAVVFVDGGALVVCGGWNGTATTGAIYRVDLAAGKAVTAGKLAAAVHDAAGAAIDDLWLVLGGGAAAPVDASQYVEKSGSAKQVGSLPAARADHVAGTIGRTVVVAGGAGTGAPDPAVLVSVDGVTFDRVATLPVPVRYPAAAVLDGKLYLLGGELASGETGVIQAIDPAARTAVEVARLPTGLSHAMAFVLNGRLYLAGGRRGGAAVRDIVAVDPATGRTTPAGTLPVAFSDGYAVTIGGKAYLVGGETTQVLDTIVALSPGA